MGKFSYKVLGLLSFGVGVFLLLESSRRITGFVVAQDLDGGVSSFFGAMFIIGGLLLMIIKKGGDENEE